jgi:DNA-binding NarL/FixJ family response regulator
MFVKSFGLIHFGDLVYWKNKPCYGTVSMIGSSVLNVAPEWLSHTRPTMLIFVIDNHPLMREVMVLLLRRLKRGLTIVELDRMGTLSRSVEKHGKPQLVCVDLRLPDTVGMSGIRQLRQAFSDVPIVVLSALPATKHEDDALEAGADIYLEKSAGAGNISHAFRTLLLAEAEVAQTTQAALAAEAGGFLAEQRQRLSLRQMQLLKLVDEGLSNRDIADRLQISEHTVKVHLWRLFRRLDVKSRTQATYWARSQGLI